MAQFELKLIHARRGQLFNTNVDENDFVTSRMKIEYQQAVCHMNFGPIANIVQAIGNFEYADTQYYSRMPASAYDRPLPQLVSFTNLEQVTAALASRETPQHVRLFFYNNNSLPFAVWGPDPDPPKRHDSKGQVIRHPDWPLLLNPEQYWPPGFHGNDLGDDSARVMRLLSFCGRKSVKFVAGDTRIDNYGKGQRSALVSNHVKGLCLPDLVTNANGDPEYAETPAIKGHVNEFWTNRRMDATAMLAGALAMVGEIPVEEGRPYECRSSTHASSRFCHNLRLFFEL